MILLDTNIISENLRPRANEAVLNWIDAQPEEVLYLCTPVVAELRYGVERLAPGRKQSDLRSAIDHIVERLFAVRTLPFDAVATIAYARIVVRRERMGRPIAPMDAMIAAIALSHGAALATRNVNDFADLGLELIDPFTAPVT
jgi:predicted nucleic acid-binding protein